MLRALADLESGKVLPVGSSFRAHCRNLKAEGKVRDAIREVLSGSDPKKKGKKSEKTITWQEAQAQNKALCSQAFIESTRQLIKKGTY